jgi:hypothetical protein
LEQQTSTSCLQVFTKLEFSEHRVAASSSGFILRIFAIAHYRVVLVAVLSLGTVTAVQTPAHALEIFADIACKTYPLIPVQEVFYRAWSVDFPRNFEIVVNHFLYVNDEEWQVTTDYLTTSSSGSWGTSTGNKDATYLSSIFSSSKFDLMVTVQDKNGLDFGVKNDSCTM